MKSRRAFTLVEVGVVAAVTAVVASIAAVATSQPEPKPEPKPGEAQPEKPKKDDGNLLGSLGKARASARQMKDGTQIRGIHQGLVMFAGDNADNYPIPSMLDKKGDTMAGSGPEKDTTANIMSVLVWNGFFGPEIMVSPAETNKSIKVMQDFEYSMPKAAVNPKDALWNPAMTVDFTNGKTGCLSYAHLMPSPSRKADWTNSFSAANPVLGNRGPRIDALRMEEGKLIPVLPAASNTFGIHGDPKTWEGNIAFNDNHVNFMTKMTEELTYKDRDGKKAVDNFFYNEPDDAADANCMMGIFTRAGAGTKFFQGIWD